MNPINKYVSIGTHLHYLSIQSFKSIIEEKLPMVINCYSDWCPACSEMKPAFEKLALEFGDKAVFAKVRIDEDSELANGLQVEVMPTFLFFTQGLYLGRLEGSIGYLNLEAAVEKLLQLNQQIIKGEQLS